MVGIVASERVKYFADTKKGFGERTDRYDVRPLRCFGAKLNPEALSEILIKVEAASGSTRI